MLFDLNEQALQVLQTEALPLAKGLHDTSALAQVHGQIANRLEDLQRFEEALR